MSALAFADDVVLIATGASEMESRMWQMVTEFNQRTTMELGLGAAKTVYSAIRERSRAKLTIAGQNVPWLPPEAYYKYLGYWVALDGNLRKEQEEMLKKRVPSALSCRAGA